MEEITCERKIESVIRVIDNPIRKGLIGRFIFWEPKKIYVREYKEIQRGTKMKLINIYKADISNRINKKCDELYKRISDENVEFENNYIQMITTYFKKYSEMMNKTSYDVAFYIESWCGLRTLLDLLFKRAFDAAMTRIEDNVRKNLSNLEEICEDEEPLSLKKLIRSDYFCESGNNYGDVAGLIGLLCDHIVVEKTFLELKKLKESYGVHLMESKPLEVAYMVEGQYPIYYCTKREAEAVECLLGRQEIFDKLLRNS